MSETIDTYCPYCDEPVVAEIIERQEVLKVLGTDVVYLAHIPICPNCGKDIGDARTEGYNLDEAYRNYNSMYKMPKFSIKKPHIRRSGIIVEIDPKKLDSTKGTIIGQGGGKP